MTMLTVDQLTKNFGRETAVKQATFQLQPQRCIALLGPNGAGKTTILKMLAGLIEPTAGTIRFEGLDEVEDIRQHIGYLPQQPVFHAWMSGREFLEYAGKLAHLTAAEARSQATQLLEKVGIAEAGNKKISQYSGGMKQRLGIAQAMIHKPKLLMLDEPVSALDPIGRREILVMMQQLKQEATVLFSTHVLNDAEEISDDVLIIRQGEIVISGQLAELQTEHEQAIIHLRTQGSAEKWTAGWQDWDNVHDIVIDGDHARIFVSDLEQVKAAILREVLSQNIPLLKFEIGRTSLEDLFMKVVRT